MPTFRMTPEELLIDGVLWMNTSERPVMAYMAARAHGRVLEVGFGMGIAHSALHKNPAVKSIDICELHPEVLEHYKWCGCNAYIGDYHTCAPRAHTYDTIFFDILNTQGNLEEAEPLLPLLKPDGTLLMYVGALKGGASSIGTFLEIPARLLCVNSTSPPVTSSH